MMENSADAQSLPPVIADPPQIDLRALIKRIIARNPFYLISAGLLLYGINQLTTDPKLVGAEFSMLRFNFCALIIYEIMLVATAIALTRRGVWYDALLLVGLANVFIIVPFSLITRAVQLNSQLAWAMSISGVLLAAGKFWAFKRYIPRLNLPGRLLIFGAALLLANAAAPLMFKSIAENPAQINHRLNVIWLIALPIFAGLANLLPKLANPVDSADQQRWLPLALYFGWIVVSACHIGGIGYSLGFDWNLSFLLPAAWVTAWTLYLRRKDFLRNPSAVAEQMLLFIPLLLPLLAVGGKPALLVFAALNFMCYAAQWMLKNRNQLALIRFVGAAAILLGSLPTTWLSHATPGISQTRWLVVCIAICFFWLIFLSRDPRVALGGALALLAISIFIGHEFALLAFQIGLVSILVHSLRWEDCMHKGATIFRTLTGVLWVLLASSWVRESAYSVCLPAYIGAAILLICCGVRIALYRHWKPWTPAVFSIIVLISKPGSRVAQNLGDASPGFLAIGASFLLFALGSLVAFSKPKRQSLSGKPELVP